MLTRILTQAIFLATLACASQLDSMQLSVHATHSSDSGSNQQDQRHHENNRRHQSNAHQETSIKWMSPSYIPSQAATTEERRTQNNKDFLQRAKNTSKSALKYSLPITAVGGIAAIVSAKALASAFKQWRTLPKKFDSRGLKSLAKMSIFNCYIASGMLTAGGAALAAFCYGGLLAESSKLREQLENARTEREKSRVNCDIADFRLLVWDNIENFATALIPQETRLEEYKARVGFHVFPVIIKLTEYIKLFNGRS